MPRVRGPLFSLEASGTLAKTLNYSKSGSTNYVRKGQSKTASPTQSQITQRLKVKQIPAAWQGLTPAQKAAWAASAAVFNLSGYSYFWKKYFQQNIIPPNSPSL